MLDSAVAAVRAAIGTQAAGWALFAQRLATVLSAPSQVGVTIAVCVWMFHNAFNLWMQYTYFYAGKSRVQEWKVQPEKGSQLTGEGATGPWTPWLTLLTPKPGRKWWHTAIMLYNSVTASVFAAVTAEFFMRDWLPMHGGVLASVDVAAPLTYAAAFAWLCFEILYACTWENVVEYYFHVIMHSPWFYTHFHKLHHTYKSPTPFDDLMIHPVDSGTYYCILYSPGWIFPMSLQGYLGYLAIMGFAGMTDHSGIRFRVPNPLHTLFPGTFTEPLLYNSAEHDLHHELFTVNYGFPFMFMDWLHGTYRPPRPCPKLTTGPGKGRGGSSSSSSTSDGEDPTAMSMHSSARHGPRDTGSTGPASSGRHSGRHLGTDTLGSSSPTWRKTSRSRSRTAATR